MAHTLSAKKRIRQNVKTNLRNKRVKSQVKTQTKKVLEAVRTGNAQAAQAELRKMARLVDKARSRGVLHANTVARKKSRLAARVNAMAKAAPAVPSSAPAPAPAAPKA